MTTDRVWRFATRADAPADDAARTLALILATESRVKVLDSMRGFVDEVLVMSGGTWPRQLPMLDAHNRDALERIRGSIRDLRIDGSNLRGVAHFANTAGGIEAYQLAREGHLTDVSIGFSADKVRWVEEGATATIGGRAFKGPLRLVEKWQAREGSLVAIGADANAKLLPASMRAYPVIAARLGLAAAVDVPPAFVIRLGELELPIPSHLSPVQQHRLLNDLPQAVEAQYRKLAGQMLARASGERREEEAARVAQAAIEFSDSIPEKMRSLKVACNQAHELVDVGFITPSLLPL